MSFPIIPKYNSVTTSPDAPLSSNLQLAELAVNTETSKLYLKGNGGVVEVSGDKVSTSQLTTLATAGGVPQLTAQGLISTAQIQGLTTSQIADLTTSAIAGKIPQLDSSGKISSAQLPAASVGALTYKGAWDVNTSPVIASGGVVDSGTAAKGDYYIVRAQGTLTTDIDGHNQFLGGDMLAFNGTTWDLIHGANSEVISVNNKTPSNGNITIVASDVGALAYGIETEQSIPYHIPQMGANGKIAPVQLPIATTTQIGALSVGSGLAITTSGILSVIGGTYTLPIATDTVLGGIKSSASINIDGTTGVATVASAGTY